MPHIFSLQLLFLTAACFFAGFIDSIAGGGGLISIPAYFFVGFPPHLALGTNKFSATAGSLFSSLEFFKSGKINFKLLKFIIPFTLLGSALGVWSVLRLSQDFLYPLVSVMILVVGVYTYFKKDLGLINTFKITSRWQIAAGMGFGFLLGFYDGFFGPGTGSFLLFIFIKFFGMDFVNAAGNGKLLNFISNVTSLVLFAAAGKIDYFYGIFAALACVIGSILGTRIAIKKGAAFVKPIFLIMSFAVFAKLIYGMVAN